MKLHHAHAHDESLAGVVVECDWCGAEFERDQRQYNRHFCSDDCLNMWQSGHHSGDGNPQWDGGMVTVRCEYCGDEYSVKQSREDKTRFCSENCKNEWQDEHLHGENHPRYKKNTVDSVCEQCGESYTVGEWRADSSRFCSYQCLGEYREEAYAGDGHPKSKEYITKFCEICGERYSVKPSVAEKRRFCSVQCMGEWRSTITGQDHPNWKQVTVQCEFCDEEFYPQPSQADEARFCSRECYGEWRSVNLQGQDHPNWKGGHKLYYAVRSQLHGRSWEKVRDSELGPECRVCGDDGDLHLHHVIPILSGGTNEPWNLVTLCESCHPTAEAYIKNQVGNMFADFTAHFHTLSNR